jgi:peptide/nickel transport system substrate-binding protein
MRYFSESLDLKRRTGAALLLLGVALLVWLPVDLPGQDPEKQDSKPGAKSKQKKHRAEEEEEGDVKVKPMVTQPEDEKPRTKLPVTPAIPQGGDLLAASKEASHFAVQQLFQDMGRPHDLVTFKAFAGVTGDSREREIKVEPLPVYAGSNPNTIPGSLTLKPYDNEWRPQKVEDNVSPRRIKSIVPYEVLAQEAVQNFLNRKLDDFPPNTSKYLSRPDQLAAAERVLGEAVRFYDSARERGERRGDEWLPVVASVKKQLLGLLLEQLDNLTKAKDWDEAFALTRRLAASYKAPEDQARIARPLTELLKEALRGNQYGDDRLSEARQRLRQLEEQFPNSDAVTPIREALRNQAQALFDRARELAKDKNDVNRAQELAKQAEETWEQLPGLRAFRIELGQTHPILRVAVRELPRDLSPARASTDTEQRAVDLLFESLVKVIPTVGGSRYHTGLAESRPLVIPMGRQFRLPSNALFTNGRPVMAADVRFTVNELKKGRGNGRAATWGGLLEKCSVGGDPNRVDVTLTQGYLEPLSLMSFKILPQGPEGYADREEFAAKPVGSGPYQYEGRHTAGGSEYALFVANPSYGSRTGKRGLPQIQEIRFYAYPEGTDLAKEFAADRLDLALDLPAAQVSPLRAAGQTIVGFPRTQPNLRVYFLAVNHRRPVLSSSDVRLALAHAIDREKLLDDYYRADLKREVHRTLNSPYPAGSWPCDPQQHNRLDRNSLDPYDPDKARTHQEVAARAGYSNVSLSLRYPTDDPTAEKAMKALQDQVKKCVGINLILEPRDPHQLREEVEQVHSFDLAYYHYDFPDETYWLWPLLGGGGPAGENYLGFKNDDVQNLQQEAMGYRHFSQVQQYTRAVHLALLREMPVIPLWQLDAFAATAKNVRTGPFDPIHVFADVDQWRLERK